MALKNLKFTQYESFVLSSDSTDGDISGIIANTRSEEWMEDL
jgi:hypothetical protein